MSLASTAAAQGNLPIPKLSEPSESEPGTGNATPRPDGEEKKSKKRSLFGFGKKKADDSVKLPSKSASPSKNASATSQIKAASPIRTDHPHFSPSSPGRPAFGSPPRLSSPAGSQIFERDVQESASLMPNSPAIPSHITTENHIPPVLDASSEAITDDHLDPDNVEIITHTSHQPASVAVTGNIGLSPSYEPSWADELAAFAAGRTATTTTIAADRTDSASNYGSFDTTDVRRLSFISFADVVQAEQQHFPNSTAATAGGPSSTNLAGLTSLSGIAANRSTSPIRSPVSSAGGGPATSPPTSKSGSVKGMEMSPTMSLSSVSAAGGGGGNSARKPLGSPTSMMSMQLGLPLLQSPGPTVNGEIAIETMSQALRRTGSGDLNSGVRSFPTSPI